MTRMSPEPSESIQSGWSESQIRNLKYAVIIMGVLIVIGFFALIAGLYMKAARVGGKPGETAGAAAPPATAAAPVEIVVPSAAGSEIISFTIAEGLLAVHTRSERGDSLMLFDAKSGRLIRSIIYQAR